MGVYFKNMQMPRDCLMCPAAHYNKLDEFTGCDAVPGKRYAAMKDKQYAESSTRPDWCTALEIKGHGRLIDADALKSMFPEPNEANGGWRNPDEALVHKTGVWAAIDAAPTIIPAEEG